MNSLESSAVEQYAALDLNPIQVDVTNTDRYATHKMDAESFELRSAAVAKVAETLLHIQLITGVVVPPMSDPAGQAMAMRYVRDDLSTKEKRSYEASGDLGTAEILRDFAEGRLNSHLEDDAAFTEAYQGILHLNALHDDALCSLEIDPARPQ